jgi:hypothetical protein
LKTSVLLALAFVAAVVGLATGGCKKKSLDEVDLAYHQSPEGIHDKIQEQKTVLSEALKKHDLVFIHDQAYYVQGLVDALAAKLDGEQKERLAPVLKELSRLIDQVHDAAGSGKEPATEARLQELFDALKQLEPEFKSSTKTKK